MRWLHHLSPYSIDYILSLVVSEQLGDLPGREQVVDEDEESLFCDLGVRHQEHVAYVLQARFYIQPGWNAQITFTLYFKLS